MNYNLKIKNMKIEIGDIVKCKDNSLKQYIKGGDWYGKTLEVAKVYKNEILLHTEDRLDYHVCRPTDIICVIMKKDCKNMKKFVKIWTLETPKIPDTNTVNVRDFEHEPTEEDVQTFIRDTKTISGTIFVHISWKCK